MFNILRPGILPIWEGQHEPYGRYGSVNICRQAHKLTEAELYAAIWVQPHQISRMVFVRTRNADTGSGTFVAEVVAVL